jgi:DNA-binding NtrC family response regulator
MAFGTRSTENPRGPNLLSVRNAVEETERGLILNALSRTQGNKAQAARALNMQRSVLYKKLERFNLV